MKRCRGLPEVKWALNWLRLQSSLLNNSGTQLSQRDGDTYSRVGVDECAFQRRGMQQLPTAGQMGIAVQSPEKGGGQGHWAHIYSPTWDYSPVIQFHDGLPAADLGHLVSNPAVPGQHKPEPRTCASSLHSRELPTFTACQKFLLEGFGGMAGIPRGQGSGQE